MTGLINHTKSDILLMFLQQCFCPMLDRNRKEKHFLTPKVTDLEEMHDESFGKWKVTLWKTNWKKLVTT